MAAPSHFGVHFEYSDLCARLSKLAPETGHSRAVPSRLKLRKSLPKPRVNLSMFALHPYKPPTPLIHIKRSLSILHREVPLAALAKPYRVRRCGSIYASLDSNLA